MTASSLLHKRKALFFVILFIAFPAFTADILDVREELSFLSCPDSFLDNDATTGITSNFSFKMEQLIILCSAYQKSSFKISLLYLLPYGFRAPPPLVLMDYP
jgi:hypothetical protein